MPKPSQKPTFEIELASLKQHCGPVVGVDEAGRGPLAGPVVAAAVAFSAADIGADLPVELSALADSKILSEAKREQLYLEIVDRFRVGVGIADRQRIDSDNILNATMWAMRAAVDDLGLTPAHVLIDGNRAPKMPWRVQTIVAGDRQCVSIAAASVIAKVTRDRLMCELAATFPLYGFEKHKGYGTKAHLEAMRRHGICEAHRRSFRPVKLLQQQNV